METPAPIVQTFPLPELERADPSTVAHCLEEGKIVHFPESPVPFPPAQDLDFLREELPRHLRRKNISYHPEAGRVVGITGGRDIHERACSVLRSHGSQVRGFLQRFIEPLARDWKVATSSFRPLQEKGRALSSHASNERVHLDAGAYGASHGDRILRFFMNAHPTEDRIWISKGAFPEVYGRYGREARVAPPDGTPRTLTPGIANRAYSGILKAAARLGLPAALLADTSPYDRLMRRFHNYMKDSPEFQRTPEGHREMRFPPGSAWMVFTDMVTHACVQGQHAFIDTFIVPLANCRRPALAPYFLFQSSPGSGARTP